jgi:hypothetical protein
MMMRMVMTPPTEFNMNPSIINTQEKIPLFNFHGLYKSTHLPTHPHAHTHAPISTHAHTQSGKILLLTAIVYIDQTPIPISTGKIPLFNFMVTGTSYILAMLFSNEARGERSTDRLIHAVVMMMWGRGVVFAGLVMDVLFQSDQVDSEPTKHPKAHSP